MGENIEDLIEEQIDLLKPELKKKFVFRIIDEKSNNFAMTQSYYNPPMITFYSNNIKKMTDKPIKQSIRELITHELIHALQVSGIGKHRENEAIDKFKQLNFFI